MKKFNVFFGLVLLLGVLFSIQSFAVRAPFDTWITELYGDLSVNPDGGVTISADAIGSGDLAANSVLSDNIVDGAVTSADIQNSSIVSGDIKDATIVEADVASYDGDGLLFKRVARVTYDVAVDGGTAGTYDLGVDLPVGALLEESVIYIETQFVDGGSGTVAIHCEDANNILSAADITGNAAGSIIDGSITEDARVAAISAACDIIATVAGSNQTAGKLILFLEYYEHD